MIYYLSTKQWPIGQAVKTLASHAGNSGSIPGWVTKKANSTSQDVLFAFLVIFLRNCTAFALAQYARVRIPHPKIDKLACQTQGVGIFAHRAKFPIFSNIARCAVCFFGYLSTELRGICACAICSGSHTPPEDRQARLSGAGCGYPRAGEYLSQGQIRTANLIQS